MLKHIFFHETMHAGQTPRLPANACAKAAANQTQAEKDAKQFWKVGDRYYREILTHMLTARLLRLQKFLNGLAGKNGDDAALDREADIAAGEVTRHCKLLCRLLNWNGAAPIIAGGGNDGAQIKNQWVECIKWARSFVQGYNTANGTQIEVPKLW